MPASPKAIALIVEKMKGAKAAPVDPPEGGDEEGDVLDESMPEMGEEAAASEAMAAMKADDAAGFARAMKTLVQLSMSSQDPYADEE